MKTKSDVSLSRTVREAVADDSGAGAIIGMFLLFTMLIAGSLAIDYSNGVRTKAQLQAVADSAVLKAAEMLPEGAEAVREAAIAHAERFGPNLVLAEDVLIGTWADGEFTVGEGSDANAVAIRARRADRNSNPLPTQLMFLVGIDRLNISAPAIAARINEEAEKGACSTGGFVARGQIDGNSSNTYRDGFCLHGEEAVRVHNRNLFEYGTIVSSADIANIRGHRNNHGLSDALRAASHTFSRAEDLTDLLDTIETEGVSSDDLPSYITAGPVHLSSIRDSDTLQRGMLYLVDGNVNLRGDRFFENVAIVATGNISISSNVDLRNVFLAARGSLSISSNVDIGGSAQDYCTQDSYSSHILALGNISLNSNIELRGSFMASQGNISMNSNNDATQGTYAEALGNITFNSSMFMQGCKTGHDDDRVQTMRAVGIVR